MRRRSPVDAGPLKVVFRKYILDFTPSSLYPTNLGLILHTVL
jgi:hypothetical protein